MRRGRGAGLVGLAVGLPLGLAGIVIGVVFAAGDVWEPSPLHRAVDDYLAMVGLGGPAPATGPGGSCPAGQPDPATTLHALAPAFEHHIVSSIESGGQAQVNVDLTPREGDRIEVVLELSRSGERWDVCSASTGHVWIDPT
ncbi:hypothetical protein ABT143_23165 [Streptomyces sp. NPDC002033]|uniref:hypothetical protein n=1 Tax=unclassified Streptomyces TaxID=2593676 RepID=UPI00332BAC4B